MRIICLGFCLFFAQLGIVQAAEKHNLKVIQIASEEYAPFTSETLKHKGVISHIVTESYRLEGIEVKYGFYPAARSFKLAQVGELDGTVPWAKRADREIDFYYSDPILNVGGEYFFYKKGLKLNWDAKTQDYNNLKDLRIGAVISYDYGQKFQDAEKKGVINIERVRSLKQLFRMLLRDHIDIVISKEWVARYALQSNFPPEQITQIGASPENAEGPSYDYVLFPRKKPTSLHFLTALNKGLAKLRASGRYDAIMEGLRKGDYAKPLK